MLKNITLSADSKLIRRAREKAQREHTTLNAQFRLWLERYAAANLKALTYDDLMNSMGYANAGKHFSRDELNER
jgi:ribosomal protein L20